MLDFTAQPDRQVGVEGSVGGVRAFLVDALRQLDEIDGPDELEQLWDHVDRITGGAELRASNIPDASAP